VLSSRDATLLDNTWERDPIFQDENDQDLPPCISHSKLHTETLELTTGDWNGFGIVRFSIQVRESVSESASNTSGTDDGTSDSLDRTQAVQAMSRMPFCGDINFDSGTGHDAPAVSTGAGAGAGKSTGSSLGDKNDKNGQNGRTSPMASTPLSLPLAGKPSSSSPSSKRATAILEEYAAGKVDLSVHDQPWSPDPSRDEEFDQAVIQSKCFSSRAAALSRCYEYVAFAGFPLMDPLAIGSGLQAEVKRVVPLPPPPPPPPRSSSSSSSSGGGDASRIAGGTRTQLNSTQDGKKGRSSSLRVISEERTLREKPGQVSKLSSAVALDDGNGTRLRTRTSSDSAILTLISEGLNHPERTGGGDGRDYRSEANDNNNNNNNNNKSNSAECCRDSPLELSTDRGNDDAISMRPSDEMEIDAVVNANLRDSSGSIQGEVSYTALNDEEIGKDEFDPYLRANLRRRKTSLESHHKSRIELEEIKEEESDAAAEGDGEGRGEEEKVQSKEGNVEEGTREGLLSDGADGKEFPKADEQSQESQICSSSLHSTLPSNQKSKDEDVKHNTNHQKQAAKDKASPAQEPLTLLPRIDVAYPLDWIVSHVRDMQTQLGMFNTILSSCCARAKKSLQHRPSRLKKDMHLQATPTNLLLDLFIVYPSLCPSTVAAAVQGPEVGANTTLADPEIGHDEPLLAPRTAWLSSQISCGAFSPHGLKHKKGLRMMKLEAAAVAKVVQRAKRNLVLSPHCAPCPEDTVISERSIATSNASERRSSSSSDRRQPHRVTGFVAIADIPFCDRTDLLTHGRAEILSSEQLALRRAVLRQESTWLPQCPRRLLALSQALTVACNMVLVKLSLVSSKAISAAQAKLWEQFGLLLVFQGLLSPTKHEEVMLEDSLVAIDLLRLFDFQLRLLPDSRDDISSSSSSSSSSSCNSLSEPDISMSGRIVTLHLPSTLVSRLPDFMRKGIEQETCRLFLVPVYFNQGIDIQQSMKTMSAGIDSGNGAVRESIGRDFLSAADTSVCHLSGNDLQRFTNICAMRSLNAYMLACNPEMPVNMGDAEQEGGVTDRVTTRMLKRNLSISESVARSVQEEVMHAFRSRSDALPTSFSIVHPELVNLYFHCKNGGKAKNTQVCLYLLSSDTTISPPVLR
jgi:hypothetical protein